MLVRIHLRIRDYLVLKCAHIHTHMRARAGKRELMSDIDMYLACMLLRHRFSGTVSVYDIFYPPSAGEESSSVSFRSVIVHTLITARAHVGLKS